MTLQTTFTAAAGFEAARRLTASSLPLRLARMHGHSFVAAVHAALPGGWAEFPGAEVGQLGRRLQDCVQAIDHHLLNEHLAEPDDVALVGWLRERLDLPEVLQLGLHSGPRQGALLDARGRVQLWRRYTFQSAHRLPNVPLGHKCGRMHGHGFEAVVHVVCGGPTTTLTHDDIDGAWAPLHHELDHRCLNDLPGLDNPTSEVLTHWLWQRLQPALPGLATVTVFETASSGALFDGRDCRIWKQFTLDSAVRLRRAPPGDALHRPHGHTYTLRLHLQAPLDQVLGWVVDFGDVKRLFTPIFDRLDHQPLYEVEELGGLDDVDAASIARWVLDQAQAELPALDRVDLLETPGCGAIVRRGPERAALPL